MCASPWISPPARASHVGGVGSTWAQDAELFPAEAAAGSTFGYHVGVDGNTLVAYGGVDASGRAAFVFRRDGSTWTQAIKLIGPGDQFGTSVSVDGARVAVADAVFFASGVVHVFEL